MRFPLVTRRILLAPALALALALAVAACGSSSSSSSSSAPASSAPASSSSAAGNSAAVAQITANWEKFFNASTPTSQRVTLLQNGAAFAAAISGLTHLVSGLGATVTSVTVNSPTSATVKYNLTASGSSLLSGQTGKAVYENGTWKVGDASLCGLLKLVPGGTTPTACSSAS
jgi:ABC-type glycerol-3-phosphate transport system substrate-binding protein